MDINFTLNIENPENLNMNELCEKITQRLKEAMRKNRKTGYERVERDKYYYIADCGEAVVIQENEDEADEEYYNSSNYYSDETVARNNARADALMRNLRRFAVEHRTKEIVWNRDNSYYRIYFNHARGEFGIDTNDCYQFLGVVYFDTEESARAAIEEYKEELIWYYTQYKDSL